MKEWAKTPLGTEIIGDLTSFRSEFLERAIRVCKNHEISVTDAQSNCTAKYHGIVHTTITLAVTVDDGLLA